MVDGDYLVMHDAEVVDLVSKLRWELEQQVRSHYRSSA